MITQLEKQSDINGNLGSDYGPYLSELPENPMNVKKSFMILDESAAFPESFGVNGWIYHPATREVRMDYPGTDSEGTNYYDY